MHDLWVVSLLFVPAVVEAWICLIFVKGLTAGKSDRKSPLAPVKMLIQITSRNAPAALLDNTIAHVVQAAKDVGLSGYRIWVVTDTPGYQNPAAKTILVPESFTANCRYKARALEYAKRERTRLGLGGSDWWIYYLDEENIVSGRALDAIIRYIHKQGKERPVAVGAITYVRSGSIIAHLCDSVRLLGYIEAHFFMQYFGYFYLQGENILVRSDIEQRVGWEFGDALAEDLLNGIEIRGKTRAKFGWHGGTIKSSSPETVGDLLKQRRRWYCGGLQGVFRRRMPFWQRLHLSYRLSIWTLGLVAIVITLIGFFFPYHVPEWTGMLLMLSPLLFLTVYFVGTVADGVKIWWALPVTLCFPFLSAIETYSAMYSLVKPAKGFDVIRKRPLVKPIPEIVERRSESAVRESVE